jgi:hypothetical protein
VFIVLTLLLNIGTLWAFMRRAKTSVVAGNAEQQKMEQKLTIYTLITFLGQILFSLYMV